MLSLRLSTLQNNMDKHYFSCGVFIDLKNAFDTINHKILLDNFIFMVFEGVSTSGSSRTKQIERKQLKLDRTYQLN